MLEMLETQKSVETDAIHSGVHFREKPVVKFDPSKSENKIDVGRSAYVYALNHPVWGERIVRTSNVIQVYKLGSFETLNTFYVPVGQSFGTLQ